VILATGINDAYYPRAKPYLQDINEHSEVENHLLCIDFLPNLIVDQFPNIKCSVVDSTKLRLPLNNFCLQHAEFCDYIDGSPEDVILFTDADIRMQRPFHDWELDFLRTMREGDVFVGYNAGDADTLLDEAPRLSMNLPMDTLSRLAFNNKRPGICWNVGVMAAQRQTWEKICDEYVMSAMTARKMFQHVAWQQWNISRIINNWCKITVMDYSFHAHNHYGWPQGCEIRDGILYYRDEVVLFRHHG
jgi:hypothetical protein